MITMSTRKRNHGDWGANRWKENPEVASQESALWSSDVFEFESPALCDHIYKMGITTAST